MISLQKEGAYYLGNGNFVTDGAEAAAQLAAAGVTASKREAKGRTMAAKILSAHDTEKTAYGPSEDGSDMLRIKFDKMTSHDITYVGIIQTARASGLTSFPIPYVLTNCHNSLCAVGGTINEDDHVFGLTAARKYGGVYVPPHLAVIHQYAREMMAEGGAMILGSDSHTRYGALGTMAVGEGGPELVKQLLGQTYDIAKPDVIASASRGRRSAASARRTWRSHWSARCLTTASSRTKSWNSWAPASRRSPRISESASTS